MKLQPSTLQAVLCALLVQAVLCTLEVEAVLCAAALRTGLALPPD